MGRATSPRFPVEHGPAVRAEVRFVAYQTACDRGSIWNETLAKFEYVRLTGPALGEGFLLSVQ